MGSAHIRNIQSAGAQTIRRKVQQAVSEACQKAREQGFKPISALDDLSVNSLGPRMDTFGKCLVRAARREGISICGGEIAQMPSTYLPGCISIVVTVVSLAE